MLRDAAVRGKSGQTLFLMGSSGGIVRPEKTLYGSIKRKATRYGDLTKPYVVAVDTADEFAEEHDVLDALFGPFRYEAYRKIVKENIEVAQVSNPGEGAAFLDPQGRPTNTRVSAVLVAYAIKSTNLAVSETPVLWHNPWAQKPLESEIWQGPQVSVDPVTYELTRRPGFDYKGYLSKRLDYSW